MTFRATAGGLDAATMAAADARYLKLAADNDPLTGTLATQALQPDANSTRDIGTAALRYKTLFSNQILSVVTALGSGATITLNSAAAALMGSVNKAGSGGSAVFESGGAGSVLFGYLSKATPGAHSVQMRANAQGSVLFGAAADSTYGAGAVTNIDGAGSFGVISCFGDYYTNATATISGSSSVGVALVPGGTFLISGNGCLGGGVVVAGRTFNVTANGAVAWGSTLNGNISATALNAVQFGVGTNSQADSVSVGTTMRLKGTTGAPTTPRNGDLWEASSAVNIRTVGVNLNLNRPTVTGSRVSGVALTNLLASLSTMNLILDSTTA